MQHTLLPTVFGHSASRQAAHRSALHHKYASKLVVNPDLTRALVSFQANKNTPFYRWFKYREAFSHELVRYVLDRLRPTDAALPRALDPFAGAGTTLTVATKMGWRATGIELLPVGTAAMRARLEADLVDLRAFDNEFDRLKKSIPGTGLDGYRFPHLRITERAFPPENENELGAFVVYLDTIRDHRVRNLFWFAALSVLEDISYTRKDGQYLRWDCRSGRDLKSTFSKGHIERFQVAILNKLAAMREDIASRNGGTFSQNVEILQGSCLDELPQLPSDTFDLVLTSPPYCNRYDYTRTYALELAFLGYDEEDVSRLRQALLSATVENKTKRQLLHDAYAKRDHIAFFHTAEAVFSGQAALHEVLALLREARDLGQLNNPNIPTMIENYFFEMNLVIHELARVLTPGGHVVMVNDNVQYNGEEVPVDLILSDFAASAGVTVEAIWVLPRGKGNSSQQMGAHGRQELRKCVYIWRKP